MYSLNVNFLKDRPEYQNARAAKASGGKGAAGSGRLLVVLGAVVGVMVPAAVGGFYGYLAWQMSNLEANQLKLDQDLQDLEAELKKAEQAQAEMKAIDDLTQGLVGVFNKVKSWSAVLSDLRDRLPQGVQLIRIQESENPDLKGTTSTAPSPAAGGAAPSPPKQIITLEGYANSVEGVGELLLLLQKSPFLDVTATRLVSSELIDNPAQIVQGTQEVQDGIAYVLSAPLPSVGTGGGQVKIVAPKVIKYQIQSAYTQKTAEDLLQVLDRSGASGLVVRIETIRRILAEQGKSPTMSAPAPANGNQPEEKTNNGV
jgi:type IV pilus assembly protein PilN